MPYSKTPLIYQLIIQHSSIWRQKPSSSLPEKASSTKQAYLKDMFKTASKERLYTIVVSPHPLSPTMSNIFS